MIGTAPEHHHNGPRNATATRVNTGRSAAKPARRLIGLALAAVAVAAGLTACHSSYATYPRVNDVAFSDVNRSLFPAATIAALKIAVDRRPPPASANGRFAINPALGTNPETARRIAAEVGGEVLEAGTPSSVPIYHIARVWVRADHAIVDVLTPIGGRDPASHEAYDALTIRMVGGVRPYRTERVQQREIGVFLVPPAWYGGDLETTPGVAAPTRPSEGGPVEPRLRQPAPAPVETTEPIDAGDETDPFAPLQPREAPAQQSPAASQPATSGDNPYIRPAPDVPASVGSGGGV